MSLVKKKKKIKYNKKWKVGIALALLYNIDGE